MQRKISAIVDGGTSGREEQDFLEILDLEIFGVKTLISILIEPSLATVVLLGMKKKSDNLA